MPLARTSRTAIAAFGSVCFFMADDKRIVRVDVDNDLLARFATPPPKSTEDYIDRLHSCRRWFEQIASAKYDEGEYAPEVNVLVVRIKADDLL